MERRMNGWLEWFEERAAIFEYEARMSRREAERKCAEIAITWCRDIGGEPGDLMGSAYGTISTAWSRHG